MNSNMIAALELALAGVAISAARKQKGALCVGLYSTAGYLLLGAYLNAQGRVKLLPSK